MRPDTWLHPNASLHVRFLLQRGHRPYMALNVVCSETALRGQSERAWRALKTSLVPSRPGEFHPEPLTDPDVNLSIYPARVTAPRLPPSADVLGSSQFDPVGPSQRR